MGMKDFMKTTGIGFVGSIYDLRDAGASKVVDFSIAVTDKYKDTETTSWFKLTAWGKTAEWIKESLNKGDLIYIEANTSIRTWDDQEGKKRESTVYNCQKVTVLEYAADRAKLKEIRGTQNFQQTQAQEKTPDAMPENFATPPANRAPATGKASAPTPIDDDLPF